MQDSEVILKDSFKYSVSSYIATFLAVITGLATRSILGPVVMGVFSELLIILQYLKYHHLGIFHALERELPYYNGKGNSIKVAEMKNVGFSATTLTSFIAGIGLIIVSMILKTDDKFSLWIKILSLTLIIQSAVSFLTVLAKTHHKFSFLSKFNFYTALLQILLTIYLGTKFGLLGILLAGLILGIVSLIYLTDIKFKFRFIFPFSPKEVWRILKIGSPLVINDFAFVSLTNMDRFAIIKFFTEADLGYYSIAIMVSGYLIMLPNLIYSVLFPRFYESFGREGEIKKLKNFFETPTIIISYFLSGIIGCMILIVPLLIRYFLPEYQAGIMSANILLLGVFFISLLGMPTYLLVALNKQKQIVGLCVFAISLAAFLNYVFIKAMHWYIEGAATAMLITYFVYATLFIAYAFRHYTKNALELLRFFARIYAPFAWVLIVILLLPEKNLLFKSDLFWQLSRLLMFIILCLPMFFYLNKKTFILERIFKLIKK